ncbi:hypothetical protein CHARACLAT_016089 [Characodon lateralis]|uniref:Uncharacterized protein n=1 Tax=Characodon lateralis TaxID=208331 RepID=A0ABU7EJJ0_9TELE|nr:hypothetical protein [Characodon lateralis]
MVIGCRRRAAVSSVQMRFLPPSLPPTVHDTDLIPPRRQPKVGLPPPAVDPHIYPAEEILPALKNGGDDQKLCHILQLGLTSFKLELKSSLSSLSVKPSIPVYSVIFTPLCLVHYVPKGMSQIASKSEIFFFLSRKKPIKVINIHFKSD